MEDKCLRILQDGVKLEELLNEEFMNKLNENFEGMNIFPIAVTFAIEKDDIVQDNINLLHRNDEERGSNTIMVDVSSNPKNMPKIINSLK